MIIAYNLCYSTCIGRPAHAASRNTPLRLGVSHYALPHGSLAHIKAETAAHADATPHGAASCSLDPEDLVIAPNGVAYLPPAARPGVLPRMLREILATRIMVKSAMKRQPASSKVGGCSAALGSTRSPCTAVALLRREGRRAGGREHALAPGQAVSRGRGITPSNCCLACVWCVQALLRALNARQFGLKMIANVSYGYTSASFSGRMPMAELADSIVAVGRPGLHPGM
jgi:DNA polymerase elongation subunit (family B)